MEFKKVKSKASIIRVPDGTGSFSDEPHFHKATTPLRTNNPSEDEESPFFPCSTQEMRDDVDVLWDYNSPHTKAQTTIVRKSKKKLNLQQSPKVPFRRHASSSNEQIKQDFCKLREELMALIAKPDHEESLILSPREEEAFKQTEGFDENFIEEGPLYESQYETDPFDDDMDDKLILFSQQVENDITRIKPGSSSEYNRNNYLNPGILPTNLSKTFVSNCDIRPTNSNFSSKDYLTKDIKRKAIDQVSNLQDNDTFNDSFDNVLSQMDSKEFDQLTQVVDIKRYKHEANNKSKVFPRSRSDNCVKVETLQPVTSKVEWHRTQSFERYNKTELPQEQLREVERKRLEAKAKLEAKKKQDFMFTTIPEIMSDSPLKCSPEEIEKKRLQALAKLEAKKQQEIIERKKQEAMRRREENRKKNAANVKSSLSTRL